MNTGLSKSVKILTLILSLIGFCGIFLYFILEDDAMLAGGYSVFILSLVFIMTTYAIVNFDKIWLCKLAKYSLLFYPLLIAGLVPLTFIDFDIKIILLIVFFVTILTILALMKLFIFDNPASITGTIILLLFVLGSIVYKRYRLPLWQLPFTLSICCFSLGIVMFGIRCFYLSEKNKYFKYLTMFGSSLISLTFAALLFKIMHWPTANVFLDISNFLMVIGTIVVLVSLPYSGFIDWKPIHKKIIQRYLVPWIFIFLLFLFKFLVPEAWNIIWTADTKAKSSPVVFGMSDYPVETKNGLKPQ